MAFFDFSLDKLQEYQPPRVEPDDFDACFERANWNLRTINIFDVTFNGYGGGRGFPYNWFVYASAEFAHFVMDTRRAKAFFLEYASNAEEITCIRLE